MISLAFPKPGEDRYFYYAGHVFGPFDQDLAFSGETIEFRPQMEEMIFNRGIYHENNVIHDKLEGNLMYHPLLGGMLPAPTAQYPERVLLPVYDLSYTPKKSVQLNANWGLAVHKRIARAYSADQKLFYIYVYQYDYDLKSWTYWEAYGWKTAPTRIATLIRRDFYSCRRDPTYSYKCLIGRRYRSWGTGVADDDLETGVDWTKPQWFDRFVDNVLPLFEDRVPLSDNRGEAAGTIWQARVPDVAFSPSAAKAKIDVLVPQMFPSEFPMEPVDYGDLAMEASSKVNANRVNMIAFLRDFRHPSDMIPKLRNLRKLKGWASNFLAVDYGILPTIDDLKSIIRAFEGVKPYVDRNGFNTFSAGHLDYLFQGSLRFDLEQHIKLAIGDEDDGFQKLIEQLDSFGCLPTCENLWDLIPYSFVLDWFVDVGGLLERVDANLRISRLNIFYATCSQKKTIQGQVPFDIQHPYTGTVKWEHYHRWVSDQCPLPPLSLDSNVQTSNHWLEVSALLAQRTKR